MPLSLDARQRAMLREMGITVWSPLPAPEPVQPSALATTEAPATVTMPPTVQRPLATPPKVMPPPMVAPTPEPPHPRSAPAPSAAPRPRPEAGMGTGMGLAMALTVHAPQRLYPEADPSKTPPGLGQGQGQGWLIVTDSVPAQDPLASDAGRLLDNLLRAMQLHKHPQVHLVVLERDPASDHPSEPGAVASELDRLARELRPSMVLLLGHVAARAALGGNEPLGRLRAVPHRLGDCPARVSYDPAFLLRSPARKADAWADCCQALALVRQASSA